MEAIEVECYAGGRADERPRSLRLRGETHRVARLLSESVEEAVGSKERIHRYRLLSEAGIVFEVVRDNDGWRLAGTSLPQK